MTTPAQTAPEESTHPYAARRARQLGRLDRLEDVGMKLVDQIERVSSGEAREIDAVLFDGQDIVLAFTRVARAVRQIMVLSQETMGMRPPKGARGVAQGGGRNGAGACSGNRAPWDYGDYDGEDEESDIEQRIEAELLRIRDRQIANGATIIEIDDDPDEESLDAEETAEIERQIFGVPNAGTPPSGRGPPWR